MKDRTLRVLLVEDNPEDTNLVEGALAELQEGEYWRTWRRTFEVFHVETLEEALDLISKVHFDVFLLDLFLPDSESLPTFLRVREKAPGAPIVILAEADDEALAIRLVR